MSDIEQFDNPNARRCYRVADSPGLMEENHRRGVELAKQSMDQLASRWKIVGRGSDSK